MSTGTTTPATRVGAATAKAALVVLAGAAAGLVPLGGSSTSSELDFAPYLPRSPHHAYAYELAQGRLTGPAREWLLASERALASAERAELPFAASGRFDPDRPTALAVAFTARGGQRIDIDIDHETAAETVGATEVFADLYAVGAGGVAHIESLPPTPRRWSRAHSRRLELPVLEEGDYVLRVQPTLGFDGGYDVRIRRTPLLAFPVRGSTTRAIKSGFGAERDAGARTHRGVDIFAPRGTPALAAMDGWVTRVETTGRGGNVVWVQPLFGNMRLYYAHLDTQLVEVGDFVLAGDVVGTIGNTGNARTTPPHLHFGVYVRQRGVRGGARDPYPFLE